MRRLVGGGAWALRGGGRLARPPPAPNSRPPRAKLEVAVPRFDASTGKVTDTRVPADREMTIQDLLRHTSGLVYGEITVNAPVKEAYIKAGVYQPDSLPFDSRGMTPAEQVERLAKAPLAHQPGTVWEYSLSTDVLGRVVEAASGMPLGRFLEERVFKPLKMADSGFFVEKDKLGRVAEALPGWPVKLLDVTAAPKNDSGGAGGVSTAAD